MEGIIELVAMSGVYSVIQTCNSAKSLTFISVALGNAAFSLKAEKAQNVLIKINTT